MTSPAGHTWIEKQCLKSWLLIWHEGKIGLVGRGSDATMYNDQSTIRQAKLGLVLSKFSKLLEA